MLLGTVLIPHARSLLLVLVKKSQKFLFRSTFSGYSAIFSCFTRMTVKYLYSDILKMLTFTKNHIAMTPF